jgi:RNA polymerase sigma-70 factor (ECF subfamily)
MNEQHQETKPQIIDIQSLAKNYDKRLFHFVLRRVKNEDDARDIVQTTYVEAIKCAHSFLGKSKPETWLMGIALNLTRNQMHKAYHRYEFSYTTEDGEENWIDNISNTSNHPEQELENKQSITNVIKAFQNMPKDMRNTALMVLVENLSYEFTAKEMRIPIGTVRSRVARARKMLKVVQNAM